MNIEDNNGIACMVPIQCFIFVITSSKARRREPTETGGKISNRVTKD